MRIRRSPTILLIGVLLVAATLTLVVQLRKHAPPEAARLLPPADGYLYIDLQWLRRINLVGELPAVSHDPEYEQFIQATGFQFERDLEQAAFAIHYPQPGAGSKTRPPRFSEVFVGRIQGQRLREYLGKISSSVDNYNSTDIYNIPLEGRTLRVAILGVDTVAASNHGDPGVIRRIVDRSRKLASPFSGPALLSEHYKHVPIASLAWAVFRVDPANEQSPPGPVNLTFLFSKPAVVLVSARYLGNLHLRADAFAGSEADAKHVATEMSTLLDVFHTAENTMPTQGTDPDVKAFFDSLKVEQQADRAVLTATLPLGFIRKALAETPNDVPEPQVESPPKAGEKQQPSHR
jgi:hypothetical protein